ncbi:MAG: ATPase [Bacteroidota bacterium]
MIIIADSGSTNTSWIIADEGSIIKKLTTEGLNPTFSSPEFISSVIKEKVLPYADNSDNVKIYFYGSGCSGANMCGRAKDGIKKIFSKAEIEVNSDLLGTARALFGREEGIACILGTGSNSCLYDGEIIIANIPPLGFILGDEGGGDYLGKRLLADYLKGIMPEDISDLFSRKYETDKDIVIQKVYRGEFPNKYIASFVVFLKDNISKSYCHQLVVNAFDDFINRNIKYYERYDKLKISFTGSIAWHFEDILREVLMSHNLNIGEIIKEPADKILEFHLSQ